MGTQPKRLTSAESVMNPNKAQFPPTTAQINIFSRNISRAVFCESIKIKRYAPSEQNSVRFLLPKLETINSQRRFNLPVRPVFAAGVVETVNFITPIFSALNA